MASPAAPPSAAAPAAPAPVSASSPPPSARTVAVASSSPSQEPIAKRVVLPRCAAWFALDAISAVEKRLLPEFFEHAARHKAQFPPGAKLPSSKTPQVYMKYRNYMVHAYRQQPHVYLTATACRRNLAGDACAIMRVHEFLTHWGIINYDVPPHAMPPALHANYALKPASEDEQQQPLAMLVHDDNATGATPSTPASVCERCAGGAVAFELSSDAKRKHGAPDLAPNGYAKRDLPLQGFCLRPGSGICDDCYLARSFPDGVDASDFVRVPAKAAWAADEDARLLDAVSTASSGSQQEACDWNQIAGKVKTKSAEECVVRFLELPLLPRVTGQQENATAPPATFAYAESANASVLDVAALVRDVDPFVAKAAARAAIQAIKDLHRLPPKETVSTEKENGESPVIKQEASADVDMENGSTETTDAAPTAADDRTEIDAAATAVVEASDAAGIASIKTEPNGTSDGDVTMTSADANQDDVAPSPVTKETLAVVQEASHATAAALLATRADAAATATAQGPMRDLVAQLLQNQLQQLELKMQQLSVLEKAVATEKESLTREKHALYMERLAFAHQKLHGGSGHTAAAL